MKKYLICDVDEKGNISDSGYPITARDQDNIEQVYRFYGLQFGLAMHIQSDNTAIDQYNNKYMAEPVGVI